MDTKGPPKQGQVEVCKYCRGLIYRGNVYWRHSRNDYVYCDDGASTHAARPGQYIIQELELS